jgi:hypothetical protein
MNIFMQEGETHRQQAITSVYKNMKSMKKQLDKNDNYKRFFWTPDYSFCGFATSN